MKRSSCRPDRLPFLLIYSLHIILPLNDSACPIVCVKIPHVHSVECICLFSLRDISRQHLLWLTGQISAWQFALSGRAPQLVWASLSALKYECVLTNFVFPHTTRTDERSRHLLGLIILVNHWPCFPPSSGRIFCRRPNLDHGGSSLIKCVWERVLEGKVTGVIMNKWTAECL